MKTTKFESAQRQRGAAALTVSMLLLFGLTLAVFYLNRGLVFEQKSSANQTRATRAFEMADAGIEWSLTMLNSRDAITTACAATTGTTTFMAKYLAPNVTQFNVVANARAGCTVSSAGALTCSCPTAGSAPTYANTTDPRFLVTFSSVAGQTQMVEVVSMGCTSDSTDCDGTGSADAISRVRALIKVKPAFGNIPASPLTAGGTVSLTGNVIVSNPYTETNGITVNSGSTTSLGGNATVYTVPGGLAADSVVASDSTLSSLAANTAGETSGDVMFATYFGQTIGQYADSDKTYRLKMQSSGTCPSTYHACCANASECGEWVNDQFYAASGAYSNFYLDGDLTLNASNVTGPVSDTNTLGANNEPSGTYRPIALVITGDLQVNSALTINGLIYAATTSIADPLVWSGSGDATINGAMITRSSLTKGAAGGLNLYYDPKLLAYLMAPTRGTMSRVPGSWRDFQ
jgi:Tfp pilus assembly protein PilX